MKHPRKIETRYIPLSIIVQRKLVSYMQAIVYKLKV